MSNLIITPDQASVIQRPELPKELQGREQLTLDQLDARNVQIGIKIRKNRLPRLRITDADIRVDGDPKLQLGDVKQLLAFGVEARRRLRNMSGRICEPFGKIAWGEFDFTKGKDKPEFVVKIEGKEVTRVSFDDIKTASKDGEPGAAGNAQKLSI